MHASGAVMSRTRVDRQRKWNTVTQYYGAIDGSMDGQMNCGGNRMGEGTSWGRGDECATPLASSCRVTYNERRIYWNDDVPLSFIPQSVWIVSSKLQLCRQSVLHYRKLPPTLRQSSALHCRSVQLYAICIVHHQLRWWHRNAVTRMNDGEGEWDSRFHNSTINLCICNWITMLGNIHSIRLLLDLVKTLLTGLI